MKSSVNLWAKSALAYEPPGTHLLKSQELDKTSIQLCSLIILTALLQLCIFIFSPQIFSSFLLLPFPFISNHF